MITSLVVAAAIFQRPGQGNLDPLREPTVVVGWCDELNSTGYWSPLAMENQARINVPYPGFVLLSLGHVPDNWPYTFQWSGISQDAQVDVARFPVLMARVQWVQGYAHMDIDVLDARGKAVRTLRSSTLNGPGLSKIDLSQVLDPASYRLRLRLIVGGDNSGCSATYDWVRFVDQKGAEFLETHPDWNKIRIFGRVDR